MMLGSQCSACCGDPCCCGFSSATATMTISGVADFNGLVDLYTEPEFTVLRQYTTSGCQCLNGTYAVPSSFTNCVDNEPSAIGNVCQIRYTLAPGPFRYINGFDITRFASFSAGLRCNGGANITASFTLTEIPYVEVDSVFDGFIQHTWPEDFSFCAGAFELPLTRFVPFPSLYSMFGCSFSNATAILSVQGNPLP